MYDRPHFVVSRVVVAVQPGVGAGGPVQGEGTTRAGADVNPALEVFAALLRATCRSDERDDVTFDRFGYSNLVNLSAGLEEDLLGNDGGCRRARRMLRFLSTDDAHHIELIRVARIAHHDVQQKPIALGLWQGIGAFLFDRILRRQHHE